MDVTTIKCPTNQPQNTLKVTKKHPRAQLNTTKNTNLENYAKEE